MTTPPPLPALRSFEAVARLGSVTLAAEELHVTHSAVSQQIKLLEAALGVALFVRAGRGLRLSEEGRLYALQIRQGLRDIAEATRLVRARPRQDELVVAVIPSFGLHWLLPRLPGFRARHADYRISLRASLDVQDLRQGLVDVAVRMGQGDWEGLARQHLFDDELLMVAAPHFNGGRLPRSPDEVLACPAIRSNESWQAWCAAAGVEVPCDTGGLWINDSNLSLEAVRLGQGVALERRSLVDAALRRGELVQLTAVTVPYPYPYWLVWPQRDEAQRKQRDFAAWLAGEVARYRDEAEAPG